MENKFLDMSMCSQEEFERVKNGFDKFINNTDRRRFFGYADKKELKKLNRMFNYVDGRSWFAGVMFIPVMVGTTYVGWKIGEAIEKKREEENNK